MPIIKVQTSFNIEVDFEAAEFYRRLGAWLIDFLVQVIYLSIASKIIESIMGENLFEAKKDNNGYAFMLMLALPCILYALVSEILLTGQSIGKKILRIRVVNENGGKASIGQYLIRWMIRTSDLPLLLIFLAVISDIYGTIYFIQVAQVIGFSFLLFFLDIILVAASKKSQRLGDMLAGTIIVRTNPKGSIDETVFLEVADNYVPVYPQIMRLSDRDINSIKSILDTARKKGDFQLAAMATEKIKNHLKIETSMSPYDFLEIVMKDYNYLSTK